MANLLHVNYLTTCKIKRIRGERCEFQILFRSEDVTEGVLCFSDLALPVVIHSAITLYLLSGPSQTLHQLVSNYSYQTSMTGTLLNYNHSVSLDRKDFRPPMLITSDRISVYFP